MSTRFKIEIEGEFRESQLVTTWNVDSRNLSQFEDVASGVSIESLNHCQIRHIERSDIGVQIEFSPATYMIDEENAAGAPNFIRTELNYPLTNGAGICSVLRTCDGKLILQRRRRSNLRYPGWLHVCGGMLEYQFLLGVVAVCPFTWMKRELKEELEVQEFDIHEIKLLGIARDTVSERHELLFETELVSPSSRFRFEAGPEHSNLILVEDSENRLLEFIAENWRNVVPTGLANLILHGKLRFGQSWREIAEEKINLG